MSPTREPAPWGSARSRLVDAAREMLIEEFSIDRTRGEAIVNAFSFLDPAKVAERAGVARSAFYHHWPEPDGEEDNELSPFQRFLGDVFATDWGDPYSPEVIQIAALHSGPLVEFIRKATAAEWERYESPEQWATYRALTAIAAFGGSDRKTLDGVTTGMASLYDGLLGRFGRRMREPLTSTDMAVSVMAILEGFWVRRLCGDPNPNRTVAWTDPKSGETDDWALVSLCTLAVTEAMTEPIPT